MSEIDRIVSLQLGDVVEIGCELIKVGRTFNNDQQVWG
jgi:hypothetical protein